MNEGEKIDVPNPQEKANFLSRILFWYVNPIFLLSRKRVLTLHDVFNLCRNDTASKVRSDLERSWEKELLLSKKPSFYRAIVKTFWKKFTFLLILPLITEGMKLVEAVFLGELLNFFSGKYSVSMACVWALALFICSMTIGLSYQYYMYLMQVEGMHIRTACNSLIYRKIMRINTMTCSKISSGQVVNMISNDVTRFDYLTGFLPYLLIAPFHVIAVIAFCWYKLGKFVLVGFAVLLILAISDPIQGIAFRALRKKTAKLTDKRVLLMSEMLTAMQIIKMCCWESTFDRLIRFIRRKEIVKVLISRLLECTSVALAAPTVKVVIFLIVTFIYVSNGTLPDARAVYSVLIVLSFLRINMLILVPFAVRYFSESLIATKRIQEFLLLDEWSGVDKKYAIGDVDKTTPLLYENETKTLGKPFPMDGMTNTFENARDGFDEIVIEFNNYCGSYDTKGEQIVLHNIDLTVKAGNMVGVIGTVGSGKSTLLNAILKELTQVSGSVRVNGTISYVPQNAWIFTASLRQNILFGSKYIKSKYLAVIKACALDKDLKELPEGDRTVLDDKGALLSGGQKARVGLARAIYKEADIYLLDDPLSAVDTRTCSYLFEHCFKKYLNGKTIVLCTHHIQFLSAIGWTVVLKNGAVERQGDFDSLLQSGLNFSAYVSPIRDDNAEVHELTTISRSPSFDGSNRSLAGDAEEADEELVTKEKQMKEVVIVGDVKYDVYLQYFLAGSGTYVLLVLLGLFCIGVEVLFILTDWWLSKWLSTGSVNRPESGSEVLPSSKRVDFRYLGPFIGLTCGSFFVSAIRSVLFISCIVNASRVLHNRMFHKILRAPLYFFTSNPLGIILNRFSKDIGIMDDIIPAMFQDAIFNTLNVMAMLVFLAVVSPYTLIATIPLIVFSWFLRRIYLRCGQNVKRLEAITRTPLFSHLSSTFQGLTSIRAFRLQHVVSDEFDEHLDFNNRAFHLFLVTQRWFQVRLECSATIFILITSLIFVLIGKKFATARIGLALSYTVMMLGLVRWTVRQTADIVSQMISVERVLEYSKLIEEPPLTTDVHPPNDWPNKGSLTLEHVFFKYSPDSPYILKDINVKIRPGEKLRYFHFIRDIMPKKKRDSITLDISKMTFNMMHSHGCLKLPYLFHVKQIGLVGRTGAGKSSFFNLIMRMGEMEGTFVIDDIDVSTLGLLDLRTKISVIPQEPVFFVGSLRSNLDPLKEFEDFQIWDALEQVELKQYVMEMEAGLDTSISEGGKNLSTGQRQLFCLARALLRKCRIMLVDEATANVDKVTDALIQKTIRRKFKDSTVLTIAHRLETIIDSDYVLVFANGEIQEFDNPYILLSKPSSQFYRLASEINASDLSSLLDLAKSSWENSKKAHNSQS